MSLQFLIEGGRPAHYHLLLEMSLILIKEINTDQNKTKNVDESGYNQVIGESWSRVKGIQAGGWDQGTAALTL